MSHSYAEAFPELTAPAKAVQFSDPRTIIVNETLARELGFDPEWLYSSEGARFLTGAEAPYAVSQKYAGHQFGSYSPLLGDGRAMLLGEITDSHGRVHDIHLKGTGPSSFSRGDGFATYESVLREYLYSEAMHALDVPTTRALAAVKTGNYVGRDGNILEGAVLARVADSHLRVGTFQYAFTLRDPDLMRRLTNFALERHFLGVDRGKSDSETVHDAPLSGLATEHSKIENTDTLPGLHLFRLVRERQARLVSKWMMIGFVHGVMNTDNTLISGQTIDYGPCAFVEKYDTNAVFSSIDHEGRYAFGQQPLMAKWNLARFVEVLMPAFDADEKRALELARAEVEEFAPEYERALLETVAAKIGVLAGDAAGPVLAEEALAELKGSHADPVQFFARLGPSSPRRVPRNAAVSDAVAQAVTGNTELYFELLEAVTHPFESRKEWLKFDIGFEETDDRFRTYCGT